MPVAIWFRVNKTQVQRIRRATGPQKRVELLLLRFGMWKSITAGQVCSERWVGKEYSTARNITAFNSTDAQSSLTYRHSNSGLHTSHLFTSLIQPYR